MYYVHRNGSIDEVDEEQLDSIRSTKSQYDLWVDLGTREVHESQMGAIPLFTKKVLGRLLCFLIMRGGRKFTAEELFAPVWCLNVSDLSEEMTVKTSVSRLRKLIEPSAPSWKYLRKTEPSFLGRRGEYYFNTESNYCLIQPKRFQLF